MEHAKAAVANTDPQRAAQDSSDLAAVERVVEQMARRAQRIAKDTGMVPDLVLQAMATVYAGNQ